MSEIRKLALEDIPAVAGLFQRVFLHRTGQSSAELQTYIRHLYLDFPGNDPEIGSLVHVRDDGVITGFVGGNALNYTFDGRTLRAGVCGSLMVEGRESDPLAGARLLKAFTSGPQDITFSETASETSVAMFTKLRGSVLTNYSLDWLRIIRPGAFALQVGSERMRPLRMFSPLVRGADRAFLGRMGAEDLRWSGVPSEHRARGGFTVAEIDVKAFLPLLDSFTSQFTVRPDWAPGQIEAILADAAQKVEYGPMTLASVSARTGTPVGAFVYHLKPGGIGRVLQVLARPGQQGSVLDAMIDHAAQAGAAALRGRTQPMLMDAMLGRRISFTHLASTVIRARDPEVLRAFQEGKGFFNGLAGEHWSRLIGDRFE